MHPKSSFWIAPNGHTLEKWQRCHNFWHDMTSSNFWRCFVSLVKFTYWSKFHVNIITGSEVMTNFFLRDWPEIGNTPVWVLPNIWILGRVRDTKFGMNASNKMLLNAAKCQGYNFYRLSYYGKTNRGGVTPPSRLRLIELLSFDISS